MKEYVALLSRNADGRASYTYGDDLYEFLKFCKNNLPDDSGYELIGISVDSLEFRRSAYYLYPKIQSKNAKYILIFNMPKYTRNGFTVFKKIDESKFILVREKDG
jgi:hypothetical protein